MRRSISALLVTCTLAACSAVSTVWNYKLSSEPPESDFELVEPVAAVQPNFNWPIKPSESRTGFAIAIIKARYDPIHKLDRSSPCELCARFETSAIAIMEELRSALQNDLARMFESDGFSVSEEVRNLNEMTFPEKDRTTMVLVPVITLTVSTRSSTPAPVYWQTDSPGSRSPTKPFKIYPDRYYGGTGVNGQKQVGTFAVRVDGEIRLLEPLTQEILLVTDIHVADTSANFAFYYWTEEFDDGNGTINRTHLLVTGYDNRENILSAVLSDVYGATYEQLRIRLRQDELLALKPDADKLKERWRTGR